MKRWHRVLAAAIALVAINATTRIVVKANLAAGLYPAQAAIDIPITTTLYASLAAALCLLLLAFLSRSALRPAIVVPALVVLYVLVAYFAVAGVYYWTDIAHYSIAAAYGPLVLVLIGFAWDDIRVMRPRMASEPQVAAAAPPVLRPRAWYLVGALLFVYALPYIHNLGCMELPFTSGFGLALAYLGLPALVIAIFGGRWIGARIAFMSARTSALVAGAALFAWIVVLGQAYVAFANALMEPQQAVRFEGVIVDKLQSVLRGSILRIQVASAAHEVISMQVNEYDYGRLKVGEHVTQPIMLGALQIPYIAHCRWLPSARANVIAK
ncbi:MAG: hypothetical protein JO292_03975 [Betaproteobacteria bacterium]|nr:hypothetical protein [Betaproteobacteria bacterium]MBV9360529.1 hypothetical protein [Betaproteobacteria bacterium]